MFKTKMSIAHYYFNFKLKNIEDIQYPLYFYFKSFYFFHVFFENSTSIGKISSLPIIIANVSIIVDKDE